MKQLSDKLSFTSAYSQSQQQIQMFISDNGSDGRNFAAKLENGRGLANVNGFSYSNSSTLLSPYHHQQSSENSHMNIHININNNNNNNNNDNCELMCHTGYDTMHTQSFFDPNDTAVLYQQTDSTKRTTDNYSIKPKTEMNSSLLMTDLSLSKSPQTVLDLESGTIHNRQCDTCELVYDGRERDLISCSMYKYESGDDSASLVSNSSVFEDTHYSTPFNNEFTYENTYTEQRTPPGCQSLNLEKDHIFNNFNGSPIYYANSVNYDLSHHDSYSYQAVTYVPEYIPFDAASNNIQYTFE